MKPCAATIRGALTKSWIAFCPPRLRSKGALKERMMPRWLLLKPYSDVKHVDQHAGRDGQLREPVEVIEKFKHGARLFDRLLVPCRNYSVYLGSYN